MSIKEFVARKGLTAVGRIGAAYYPNQKDLLDDLREERYALIIFDALRYDYAKQILPLYLTGDIQPVWSAAHDTFQYGKRCWGDEIYDDHYISGAVPINNSAGFEKEFFNELYQGFKPGEHLPNLVEAWKDAWDTSLGTVNPDSLTQIAREYTDKDKLVTHYFQPHAPYIGRCSLLGHTEDRNAEPLTGEPVDKPLWERVKSGEVSSEELQLAYRSNVHRGVEAALPLIQELCEQDRRVVIMADHGELLGKLRKDIVSHPRMSFPQIRKVPWMEVDGVREYPSGKERVDGDVEVKLEALGYR